MWYNFTTTQAQTYCQFVQTTWVYSEDHKMCFKGGNSSFFPVYKTKQTLNYQSLSSLKRRAMRPMSFKMSCRVVRKSCRRKIPWKFTQSCAIFVRSQYLLLKEMRKRKNWFILNIAWFKYNLAAMICNN